MKWVTSSSEYKKTQCFLALEWKHILLSKTSLSVHTVYTQYLLWHLTFLNGGSLYDLTVLHVHLWALSWQSSGGDAHFIWELSSMNGCSPLPMDIKSPQQHRNGFWWNWCRLLLFLRLVPVFWGELHRGWHSLTLVIGIETLSTRNTKHAGSC